MARRSLAPLLPSSSHEGNRHIRGNPERPRLLLPSARHGDRWGEAETLSVIGSAYQELGNSAEAIEHYRKALDLARSSRHRKLEADVLTWIASVHANAGEKQKALEELNQALSIERTLGFKGCDACTLQLLGSIYEISGRTANDSSELRKALDYYQQAIATGEYSRTVARLEEFKNKIAGQWTEIYERAISLHMRFQESPQAFDLSERARARTFLDQIGNAHINIRANPDNPIVKKEQALRLEFASLMKDLNSERAKPQSRLSLEAIEKLENLIVAKQKEYQGAVIELKVADPEYASLRSINTLALPDVQRLLDKDTTLLSYFITSDKTLVFVITADGFRVVELRVSKKQLESTVKWFRRFDDTSELFPKSLTQLHDWLVAPLIKAGYLKTGKLCIIPHGVLHYLPFGALTDGQKYLADDYSIFVLPSASVLPFIEMKRKRNSNRLLALSQNQAEGLSLLEFADREAQDIATLYQTRAHITPTATKTMFRMQGSGYDLVHIAAHGELDGLSPLFSRLYLAPENDDDGSLTVSEVYEVQLKMADLVMLSACDTQLGEITDGDDVVGLTRAFIYAGSPTVIASLWSADDEATGKLMKAFYTHLKSGQSKVRALREAQREIRAQYPNPYYWAAFVLTGDPGSDRLPN